MTEVKRHKQTRIVEPAPVRLPEPVTPLPVEAPATPEPVTVP